MQSSSTPLEHSDEGREFLQRRLARFGVIGASLGFFFLAFRFAEAASMGNLDDPVAHPASIVLHALAASSLLVIFLVCRRGQRSLSVLRRTETICTLLACAAYAAMGLYLPLVVMPHMVVILAVGLGLIARAIYVPSSGRRTLVVTVAAAGPILVATYLMYRTIQIEDWAHLAPRLREMGVDGVVWSMVMAAAAWWLCITLICSGASGLIYGLRKEVQSVRKLGQYTLTEKLGEGGMGAVYRASHAMLRRPTAVKLLLPDKAGEQALMRFEREVQLTAMLTHPNTITIFDYGRTPDGVFYYVMELLDGATLDDVVEVSGPLPPARVIKILDEAAGALAEAHAVNLIHRDIKPGNLMLVEQGGKPDVLKVLDFGLVKELDRTDDLQLTAADRITGTPQYLPPEAVKAPETVDARSDLYALGAIGYYLLTGHHVFEAETVVEICSMHLQSEPVPPSSHLEQGLPEDLEALILRCLEKAPEDRPPTSLALQRSLRGCVDFGGWSEEQAKAWWNTHREAIDGLHAKQTVSGPGLTMEVRLSGRDSADA